MTEPTASASVNREGKRWLSLTIVAILGSMFILSGIYFWPSGNSAAVYAEARRALEDGEMEVVIHNLKILRDDVNYVRHCNLLEGGLLVKSGRFADSLYPLQQAAHEPTLELDACIFAGQAQYQLRRVGEARLLWTRALQLNPASPEVHRWLGVMHYDLGAMDHAIEHLERLSSLSPQDPRPHRLLGSIYLDFEKYTQAVEHYQISLRRDPEQRDRDQVLMGLAEAQARSSDHEGALKTLESCPPSVDRLALQAECKLGLGDKRGALDLTEQALTEQPAHMPSAKLRSTILLEEGRAEDAVALLEETIERYPYDHVLPYTLSLAYKRLGDDARAETAMEQSELLKKKWEEFSALNTDAIQQPSNADIRFQLGSLARDLGRADLEMSWYQAALAINPSHDKAAAALAELQRGE